MKNFRKSLLWTILLPLVCTAFFAFKGDNRNFLLSKHLDIFHAVFRELDLMYVDTIDIAGTLEAGISAMLSKLDPYTVYYPEDEEEDLKMMLTGKYAGVGAIIRYHKRYDRVVVVEPYEGMPALNAGLRAGDILLAIDGDDLKGLSVDKVSDRLRGEAGTTLTVRAKREGVADSIFEVKLTRANIALPSVPYYTMLSDSIGYIILNSFTEGCAREVRLALVELKDRGAKRLVLDLRGNGGGSLSEAVDITGLFVPKGSVVVTTKGKIAQATQSFCTRCEPLDATMPLVVLVDGQSASASEIVAGAIQDFDRGVIMGRRTYGKGLVQTVRDLPYNNSLKLTTGKYYTPSGRCVQAIDYARRAEDGSVERIPDSLTSEFRTVAGRSVRDGGGITPDIPLQADSLPNILFYLANSDALFDFATDYTRLHPTIPPVSEFVITDSLYAAFLAAVKASDFTYDRQSDRALTALKELARFEGYAESAAAEFAALEKKLTHDIDHDFRYFEPRIKELLADELVSRYYYQRGTIEQALKTDSTVIRARHLLTNEPEYRAVLSGEKK